MIRQLEENDHVLAVLLSRACTVAGVEIRKTENNYANVGVTPHLALARAMRDIRKESKQ